MSLLVELGLDDSGFRTGLDGSVKDAKSAGMAMAKALAAATVGFGIASVKAASDAQTAFAKLETIAGKDIGKLKAQIMEMPSALGRVGGAAEAAYEALSAGVKSTKAIEFVTQAAIAAKGGFTDMKTSVDAATTIMNSYGEAAGDSQAIFDKFLVTQNLGKTTFGEIGASIGQVAATAKEFGVPFNDLLGQLATLTASGLKTPQAITSIRAAISNLQKPTDDAQAELGKLGVKVEDIKALGITGLMEVIKAKSTDTSASVAAIFGSVEAGTAANIMVGNLEALKTNIDGVSKASGDAKSAADIMMNTLGGRTEAIAASFERIAIGIGDKLIPEVEKAAKFLEDNLGSIKDLAEEVLAVLRDAAGLIGSISGAAGTAVAAAQQAASGNISGAVAALGGSQASVGATAAALRGDAGGIVSALGGDTTSIGGTAATGALEGLGAAAKGIPGLGALLQAGGMFGGFRAAGGPVSSGSAYVVGENGPEVMVPGKSGAIIPNGGALPGMAGLGGGQSSSEDYFESLKARIKAAFHSGSSEGLQTGGKDGMGSAKGKEAKGLAATLFSGAFDSSKVAVIDAFKSGDVKGGIKAFSESLKDTASQLLQQGLSSVLSGILGSLGGGGGLGGLLGFAEGGSPPVGVPSIVGERGPELFVPSTAGTIVPNHQLGGIGGGPIFNIHASGESEGRAAGEAFVETVRNAEPALARALRLGQLATLQAAMVGA